MIEKIRNIFAIPELRRKILFTLALLVVVRIGAQIPIPGINPDALLSAMETFKILLLDFLTFLQVGHLLKLLFLD